MALSMATFAAQPITTPALLPYNYGPSPLNNFYIAPTFLSESLKQQSFPLQQDYQMQSQWESLELLINGNKNLLYTEQQYSNSNQQQGHSNNQQQNSQKQEKKQDWTHPLEQYMSSDQSNNQDNQTDKNEFEEWQEKLEEERKELYNDFQYYILVLIPYLLFEKPVADYLAATKLLSFLLSKYGVKAESNLLFLLFVQCIDIVALSRGRLKFAGGYKTNWYLELYDHLLGKLTDDDIIRLGTQLMLPQTGSPVYEE